MSEQEKRDNPATPKESVSSEKKAKAPKKKEKKPNRLLRWFKDLKGELKKVTWPTAKDTIKNVGVVIVCVIFVGIFIWLFDYLARAVIQALFALFKHLG
ncbi:MAG: preprotein translocase subunit SecE [Oscillospiraceae bacterium]|nr:preprotein translocase subunit SecE [Oscillospiraceae bacterium]MDE7003710.1 preprotein translocase subunit SecE [Oscillospiraceae bacterium]